jgi:hypothetical protein
VRPHQFRLPPKRTGTVARSGPHSRREAELSAHRCRVECRRQPTKGTRPATCCVMSGKASMGGIMVSRLRPPWFETMMPSTPARMANSASDGCSMPLSNSLPFTTERNHSTSRHIAALCSPGSDAARTRAAWGRGTSAGIPRHRPHTHTPRVATTGGLPARIRVVQEIDPCCQRLLAVLLRQRDHHVSCTCPSPQGAIKNHPESIMIDKGPQRS